MKTKADGILTELTINADARRTVESRLEQAITHRADVQQEYDSLRTERQTALTSKQEITDINFKLKQMQELLELAEDTVVGLCHELSRLASERGELIRDHAAAVLNQDTEELKALAATYNKQAEQLAKTVRGIWTVRRRLKEDPLHSRVLKSVPGWGRNALEIIPKLYLAGEQVPSNLTETSFFNANVQ